MSELSHYDRLGVTENSTFEEIQEARSRLIQEHSGDRQTIEAVEAAYDAILMDRLRLRQEGKIKVPDGIRFPEKSVEPAPSFPPTPINQSPGWLQNFLDTPTRNDIIWPAGLFAGASLLSFGAPSVALAFGFAFSLYFLNRKEHKFGRAFLLTLVGLILGILVGVQFSTLLTSQLAAINLSSETFAALLTFIILWLISSFLR